MTAAQDAEPVLFELLRRIREGEAAATAHADANPPNVDDLMSAALAPVDAAYDAMERTQAKTPAGLAMKAEAVRRVFERTVCNAPLGDGHTSIATIYADGEWHERLAWSLAADVLAWASEHPEARCAAPHADPDAPRGFIE